jgi:hypothetical protein
MRNNFNYILVLILFTFIINACINGIKKIETKELSAYSAVNLNNFEPELNLGMFIFIDCKFCTDKDGSLYFLDFLNHRILNFTEKGKFIRQIGRIGKDKNGLFYPGCFSLYDSRFYIFDEGGKKLKIWDISGNFLFERRFENVFIADSSCITDKYIIFSPKYKDRINYNKKKLISVYTKASKKIKNFGKIIKCKNYEAYVVFNKISLKVKNNYIYGCFENYPIVFCYNIEGKEVFYKDLREFNIKEINNIDKKFKTGGFDTPESIKRKKGIYSIRFNSSIEIDNRNNIYISIQMFQPFKSVILKLDKDGNLLQKIYLKYKEKPIHDIFQVYRIKNNLFYIIGKIIDDKDLYLFKVNI